MQILQANHCLRNAKNYYLQEYFYNVMYSVNPFGVQEARIVTKCF